MRRYQSVVPPADRQAFPGHPGLADTFLPDLPTDFAGVEAAVCSGATEGKGSCGEWFRTPEQMRLHRKMVHESRRVQGPTNESLMPNVPVTEEFQFTPQGKVLVGSTSPEGPL